MKHKIQNFFVKKIYADHNSTRAVRSNIAHLIGNLKPGEVGLNIGAGFSRLSPQIKNMEIEYTDGIDIVGSVEKIPEKDNSFELIITQEVLEHVKDPFLAMLEINRVLKPGGFVYIQLPFIIGYHGCPDDYWRFTKDGMQRLAEIGGFRVVKAGTSVGAATGFYRIIVEFSSILLSVPFHPAYRGFKAFFSLLFYPIKWLDAVLELSPEAHRVEGGYFMILTK